ncbi:hypothetical protein [Melittangium boletus]|uniref:hypothetical protein n=1 Tax=Melittangium boletus TaxID=83453 RepID=UPI003DA40FEC
MKKLYRSCRFLGAMLLVTALGCGPSRYSVSALAVSPLSLMVSTKSDRTLYVVLDPAKVPTEMTVLVNDRDRGVKLTEVQEFVSRDLKKAFSTYFDDVQVVSPDQSRAQKKPHVVVDVKIERVEVTILGGGLGSAALNWGMGMRASESKDYLYAFAGESTSTSTFNLDQLFRAMFEKAIGEMLQAYSDKKVHEEVLSLP